MPLDKAVLETLIKDPLKTELKAEIGVLFQIEPNAQAQEWFDKFCQAVAYSVAKIASDAVVTHIKAAAVVNVTTPGAQAGSTTLPGTGTVT